MEVRYSENYGGEYVSGFALGFEVRVWGGDSAEFPDYGIALDLEPQGGYIGINFESLAGLADLIARRLALAGYEVVREFGPYVGDPHAHYLMKFPTAPVDADKLEIRTLPYPAAKMA